MRQKTHTDCLHSTTGPPARTMISIILHMLLHAASPGALAASHTRQTATQTALALDRRRLESLEERLADAEVGTLRTDHGTDRPCDFRLNIVDKALFYVHISSTLHLTSPTIALLRADLCTRPRAMRPADPRTLHTALAHRGDVLYPSDHCPQKWLTVSLHTNSASHTWTCSMLRPRL